MNTRRCYSLLIAIALIAGRDAAAGEPQAGQALERAVAYLWSQQAEDGGWHSPQYGVLKSGQALAPYVLSALLRVPESAAPRTSHGVERALQFIRRQIDDQGAIGHADPDVLEYPVYSTAYALDCLTLIADDPALAKEGDRRLTTSLFSYLATAQFDEGEGFDADHPAYGGWGFDASVRPGEPGHMDLAHTRRALDALRSAVARSSRPWRPEFTRAELFLRVVQRHPGALATPPRIDAVLYDWQRHPYDGGFYFSPIVEDANKGRFVAAVDGQSAPHFRSYATATCDGILALLAAGVPREDERLSTAVEWLQGHTDIDYPQGVPTDHPEPWGEAIRFYHYAVRAEVYQKLDFPPKERAALATAVAKLQREDGSFVNTASPLMKEDDPVLCTALAVVALANCRP